jgi:hypothetical protein
MTSMPHKHLFYRLVWHTIDCINRMSELDVKLSGRDQLNSIWEDFKSISTDGATNGCVRAPDGYLLRIAAPTFGECKNVAAYLSGHYCTYGVNVQAMCDTELTILLRCIRFIFLKLRNLKKLLNTVCQLHNFCIDNMEFTSRISHELHSNTITHMNPLN